MTNSVLEHNWRVVTLYSSLFLISELRALGNRTLILPATLATHSRGRIVEAEPRGRVHLGEGERGPGQPQYPYGAHRLPIPPGGGGSRQRSLQVAINQ